jgi:hypothetical protein
VLKKFNVQLEIPEELYFWLLRVREDFLRM